jgi:hypothetical protein
LLYNSEIIIFLMATFGSIGLNLFMRRELRINFLWLTNIVFLIVIVPKIVLLLLNGHRILTTSESFLSLPSIVSGVLLVCTFVSLINLVYFVYAVLAGGGNQMPAPARPLDIPIRLPLVVFIMPVFLLSFTLFVYVSDINLQDIFLKPELVEDDELNTAYFLQKLTQVIKCAAFLLMAKILVEGNVAKEDRFLFIFVAAATIMVFLISGQRSGIALFVILLALCFQRVGSLSPRILATLAGLFLLTNYVILSARFAVGNSTTMSFSDVFLRRYFFDFEKIAGVLELSSKDHRYLHGPFQVLLDTSARPELNMSLHHFLGTNAFGTSAGVPPSVLGDMLFYFGGIGVIPLTIALTLAIIRLERLERSLRDARAQLAVLAILATFYLFLLNSDFFAAINRVTLELALLGAAFIMATVSKSFRNPVSTA